MRFTFLALAGLTAFGGNATETIDRKIEQGWKDADIRPSAEANDYEFLRRLSTDLRGVIPTPDEIRQFAASTDASKREKMIDRWLKSDAFVRSWAERWTRDLLGAGLAEGEARSIRTQLSGWVEQALRSNMPYDRFARRLLTSKGPTQLDPAAGYLVTLLFEEAGNAKDAAVRTARIFLGMQIRCAECHDHPFDDWMQEDFKRLTAFFARTRTRISAAGGEDRLNGRLVDFGGEEERSGDEVTPHLKGASETPRPGEHPRRALARILIAQEQFARAAVNRHWGLLLGRGLVHPLDGFTRFNRPKPGSLLDDLAKDFAAHGYDVRRLLKSILMSRAYQVSSRGDEEDPVAPRLFARATIAPMRPHDLFNSVLRSTGMDRRMERGEQEEFREEFARQVNPGFQSDEAAGGADREPTISQALLFLNGWFAGEGIQAHEDTRLGRLLRSVTEPGARIEELFLATLSRPPAAEERAKFLAYVRKHEDEERAYEDVFWALINSTEFVTRH